MEKVVTIPGGIYEMYGCGTKGHSLVIRQNRLTVGLYNLEGFSNLKKSTILIRHQYGAVSAWMDDAML